MIVIAHLLHGENCFSVMFDRRNWITWTGSVGCAAFSERKRLTHVGVVNTKIFKAAIVATSGVG